MLNESVRLLKELGRVSLAVTGLKRYLGIVPPDAELILALDKLRAREKELLKAVDRNAPELHED